MTEERIKPRLPRYIRTSCFLVAFVVICLIIENPFGEAETREIVRRVCNAFTVPGIVFSGIGALSYIFRLGVYDGILYSFSNFTLHNIWVTRQPKSYKTFYEYKRARDEKGRGWLPHVLTVGLVSLLIGVLLLAIYLVL